MEWDNDVRTKQTEEKHWKLKKFVYQFLQQLLSLVVGCVRTLLTSISAIRWTKSTSVISFSVYLQLLYNCAMHARSHINMEWLKLMSSNCSLWNLHAIFFFVSFYLFLNAWNGSSEVFWRTGYLLDSVPSFINWCIHSLDSEHLIGIHFDFPADKPCVFVFVIVGCVKLMVLQYFNWTFLVSCKIVLCVENVDGNRECTKSTFMHVMKRK